MSNIKPFRGCPHITAAAGGEGFVNADVSRGEGKSIIILPYVIVCGGGSNPRSKMLLQIFYYSKGLLQQHNIDMKDFLRAKMSQIEGKIV